MTKLQPRAIEELLETVFTEREQGRHDSDGVLLRAGDHAGDRSHDELRELQSMGLVQLKDGHVELTADGDLRARGVVRRHRLAERLFHDLLELGESETESHACEFEHVLSSEATDSVCTLLGHPPTCPHGKAIPPGPCCGAYQKTVRPLVTGLGAFEIGAKGRIVFIAPKFHDRMDRLAALGVMPGSEIRLHQREPSYVIEVGETTIALDPEIAGEIFVKRIQR
ncbi:MAG TPA: metal-dependent transcriptional regulator [Anaeromyxobacteraceae bacterium]|nr:metal-dependent transcriptional regulator [Anaeromyxobacteraceae bacterium]